MPANYLFTYGTLQPGESNHRLIEGLTTQPATAAGLALYLPAGHCYFPYALCQADATAAGTLVELPEEDSLSVLRRLDLLEGYDPTQPREGHYRRITCHVISAGWSGRAWVYIAGPRTRREQLRRILGDDWSARSVV